LLRRSDRCVETSVYSLPTVTAVARLISKLILTTRTPHQTLPQLQFYLINPRRKEYSVSVSLNKGFNFSINSIPCFTQLQVLILQTRIEITNKVQFDRYVQMFRFYILLFPLCFKWDGRRTMKEEQSLSPWVYWYSSIASAFAKLRFDLIHNVSLFVWIWKRIGSRWMGIHEIWYSYILQTSI
jgi:hypothetical protein